jgi:DNA polymerase I
MHRAYHALPMVRGAEGRPVNALVGFTNMLAVTFDRFAPRAVAVAVDSREPGYRNALWPAYQAQRPPFDADIVEQLDVLVDYLAAFAVEATRLPSWEADDVLATLATREQERGGSALVLTSDRDAYQLVSDAITVIRPAGRGTFEPVDREGVVERYGVVPEQVVDLIALRGDPSDNIPGAPRIGVKTAAALLRRHGTLEAILRERPDLDREQLRRFAEVARMHRDLDVAPPPDGPPDWAAGAEEARRRGMNDLARRLERRS